MLFSVCASSYHYFDWHSINNWIAAKAYVGNVYQSPSTYWLVTLACNSLLYGAKFILRMPDDFFISYANGKELKKLELSKLTKQERAYLVAYPAGHQQTIRDFLKKFYPDHYEHYSNAFINIIIKYQHSSYFTFNSKLTIINPLLQC